jgi:hypothetical protein
VGPLNDPISGDTFTAIFEIDYPEDSFELYGFVSETVDATEQYHDYAPDVFAPYYEASSDDDPVDDDEVPVDNGGDNDEGSEDEPIENSEENNNDDNQETRDDSNGTPGFELFALIAAFAAVVFIIKKRH